MAAILWSGCHPLNCDFSCARAADDAESNTGIEICQLKYLRSMCRKSGINVRCEVHSSSKRIVGVPRDSTRMATNMKKRTNLKCGSFEMAIETGNLCVCLGASGVGSTDTLWKITDYWIMQVFLKWNATDTCVAKFTRRFAAVITDHRIFVQICWF